MATQNLEPLCVYLTAFCGNKASGHSAQAISIFSMSMGPNVFRIHCFRFQNKLEGWVEGQRSLF